MPPPAVAGGAAPLIYNLGVGQRGFHFSLLLVRQVPVGQPQALQLLQAKQRRNIPNFIVANVQVEQFCQPTERCQVGKAIGKQFQILHMRQRCNRRQIGDIVVRNNQYPQFRQVIQKAQIVNGVVAHIQVFEVFKVL